MSICNKILMLVGRCEIWSIVVKMLHSSNSNSRRFSAIVSTEQQHAVCMLCVWAAGHTHSTSAQLYLLLIWCWWCVYMHVQYIIYKRIIIRPTCNLDTQSHLHLPITQGSSERNLLLSSLGVVITIAAAAG